MADLQTTLAFATGKRDAYSNALGQISTLHQALSSMYQTASQETDTAVATLNGNPGFGIKTTLTQEAEKERLAGISALIDAIKANHSLYPAAAQTAWIDGVATVTANPHLEDPVGIVSAIMRIAGCADWAAFLALVIAGDKADLMAAVS